MLLAMVIELNLEVEQIDVKNVFLYGDLDETIYIKQLEGFVIEGREYYVCKLSKYLYGLK